MNHLAKFSLERTSQEQAQMAHDAEEIKNTEKELKE